MEWLPLMAASWPAPMKPVALAKSMMAEPVLSANVGPFVRVVNLPTLPARSHVKTEGAARMGDPKRTLQPVVLLETEKIAAMAPHAATPAVLAPGAVPVG